MYVTSMKIPILLMARELHIGGSERQLTETAKFIDRSVFEPRVGCFRPLGIRGDELREAGIPIIQFAVASYASSAAITEAHRLACYINTNRIRIVHTWDYPLNVYAIPITRMMTNAIALSSQGSHRKLIPPMYRTLTRISDRFAHAIVVNCEYLRRHLRDDEHIPEAKIQVCNNGIDLDRFIAPISRTPMLTIGTVCGLRPKRT